MRKLYAAVIVWFAIVTMSQAALLVYKGRLTLNGIDGESRVRETLNIIYILDTNTMDGGTFYYSNRYDAWYRSVGNGEWVEETSDGRRDLLLGEFWNYSISDGSQQVQFDVMGFTALRPVPTGLQDPSRVDAFRILRLAGNGWFSADDGGSVWGVGSARGILRLDVRATAQANDPEGNDGDQIGAIIDIAQDLQDDGYSLNGDAIPD